MPASRALIVYYSRTGTTAKLADAIAKATHADVEVLIDTINRAGLLGFLRSLLDTVRRADGRLMPLHLDPSKYELVIIGTPDWGADVSAPVRSFLELFRGRLPQVAFFLTDGTSEHDAVFKNMAQLLGKEPIATLGVSHEVVKAGGYEVDLARFVNALQLTPLEVPTPQPV